MREDLIERLRIAAKIHRDIGGQSALAATIEEAAAALSAGQADARRYRWLKCGGWEVLQDSKYWLPELDFDGAVDNAIASVAIDAAIAASGERGEVSDG